MYYPLKLMAQDRMKHTAIILQIFGILKVKSSIKFEFQMQEMGKKNLGGMIFILKIQINCVGTIFSVPTTLNCLSS